MRRGAITSALLGVVDDRELARRAALGDHGAFELLFRRHWDALLRVCQAAGAREDEAAEAAQRAFVKAWRSLQFRHEAGDVGAWLRAIARNEVRMLWRESRAAVVLDDELIAVDPSPDEIVLNVVEIRDTLEDVALLPEQQRIALSLRAFGGMGYDEIGESLGIQPATARRSVGDARRSLTDARLGREMACEDVRGRLVQDRRSVRARDIRSHLSTCVACRRGSSATPVGPLVVVGPLLVIGSRLRRLLGFRRMARVPGAAKAMLSTKATTAIAVGLMTSTALSITALETARPHRSAVHPAVHLPRRPEPTHSSDGPARAARSTHHTRDRHRTYAFTATVQARPPGRDPVSSPTSHQRPATPRPTAARITVSEALTHSVPKPPSASAPRVDQVSQIAATVAGTLSNAAATAAAAITATAPASVPQVPKLP